MIKLHRMEHHSMIHLNLRLSNIMTTLSHFQTRIVPRQEMRAPKFSMVWLWFQCIDLCREINQYLRLTIMRIDPRLSSEIRTTAHDAQSEASQSQEYDMPSARDAELLPTIYTNTTSDDSILFPMTITGTASGSWAGHSAEDGNSPPAYTYLDANRDIHWNGT